MSDISRRDALGLLAAVPLAAGLGRAPAAAERLLEATPASTIPAAEPLLEATPAAAAAPKFFTPHEWRTVHVLADMIIPRDERSGSASDAGVPAFIDFTVDDRPSLQTRVRGGLAWLDAESRKRFGAPFVELAERQRIAILDDIAWPAKAKPDLSQGVAFFNLFRDLTASGFYSSRMGIEDLQYRGNTVVMHWDGCPPEACEHLGVSYKERSAQ